MSEAEKTNIKCPHHGELEEKVSAMKEDTQELKDGQKEILKKIDRFMEVRLEDFKACAEHRSDLKTYVDTKVTSVGEKVTINSEGILKNKEKTQKIYTYVAALMAIFAITVTVIKLI